MRTQKQAERLEDEREGELETKDDEELANVTTTEKIRKKKETTTFMKNLRKEKG